MNRGNDDKENNEEKKIVATRKQFKEHKDNESNIPELICKLDKDDSSDDSSEDDTPRRSNTPRRREQIPIEKRLKQLKEAIERISSAQRGNRMSGLQERNREDSDSESDNEEEDDRTETEKTAIVRMMRKMIRRMMNMMNNNKIFEHQQHWIDCETD